jgi:hypothetical protein
MQKLARGLILIFALICVFQTASAQEYKHDGNSDGGTVQSQNDADRIRKYLKQLRETGKEDQIVNPSTGYLSDPREREFSPEEEIKYQFRDKLVMPGGACAILIHSTRIPKTVVFQSQVFWGI